MGRQFNYFSTGGIRAKVSHPKTRKKRKMKPNEECSKTLPPCSTAEMIREVKIRKSSCQRKCDSQASLSEMPRIRRASCRVVRQANGVP